MYDGYFCIITSELDYDERKIRQVYCKTSHYSKTKRQIITNNSIEFTAN